jgi:pyrimidine operon attenuation protein/uracil phosphoribosyltransferase
LSGGATFYDNGTTAMRLPRGTVVKICGKGGCIVRVVNDYGPQKKSRVVDLYRPDFFIGLRLPVVSGPPRSRCTSTDPGAVSFAHPFSNGPVRPPGRPGEAQEGAMSGRQIMTADEIRRATIRLSHEIVEKQAGTEGLLLIGIQRRGVPLARRIAAAIAENEGTEIPSGRSTSRSTATTCRWSPSSPVVKGTELPSGIDGKTVILVDDCPVHRADDPGRDGRAGRLRAAAGDPPRGPRSIAATASCRFRATRREERPTSREELVRVHVEEIDGEDGVEIERMVTEPAAEGAYG